MEGPYRNNFICLQVILFFIFYLDIQLPPFYGRDRDDPNSTKIPVSPSNTIFLFFNFHTNLKKFCKRTYSRGQYFQGIRFDGFSRENYSNGETKMFGQGKN
jgi:hypothetical protein